MQTKSRIFNTWFRVVPPLLLTLANASVAKAQLPAPEITIVNPCPAAVTPHTFKATAGTAMLDPNWEPFIKASAKVAWSGSVPAMLPTGTTACTPSADDWICAGLTVKMLKSAPQTPSFTGMVSSVGTRQKLHVTATPESGGACSADFTFRAESSGSGWGDPHLTTVDGVHYDFQSAGEFTALREDGFEVQTRQSPVPTATVPITNPYTGITHCVAIYTAVAAKLSSSRVTVQPYPSAEPDPNSMQVRVNGKVVTLGNAPHVVYAGGGKKGAIDGTITKHPDGVFEITDARGTQLVVTSSYWSSQKVWYLNVNIYGTSAREGTMGRLAARSWLPALPDGSSLGAKPASESERYQVLYEKFADAWRVTDATSLFDYESTNTASFTVDEWPRNHPQSCAIGGQTSAKPVTQKVAEQACANIIDETRKADCVFDVSISGNTGFGKSYEVMQRFTPLPLGWYSPVSSLCQKCPKCSECRGRLVQPRRQQP